MEADKSAELTGTNRSCGLTILLRQSLSLAPGVRVLSDTAVSRRAGCPPMRDPRLRGCLDATKVSGDDIEEVTPDPIPNSEVKLLGADGTARAT